jgi:hypothetical protein
MEPKGIDYFQQRTDERLLSIEEKIDKLLEFKHTSLGKIAGASIVISAIVSLVVGLGSIYFGVR